MKVPTNFVKWLKKAILLSTLLAMFYGCQLLNQDVIIVGSYVYVGPLVGAVDLAFGQINFLPNYKKYSVPEIVAKNCQFKLPADGISCMLVSTAGLFYDECAWWRFEKCAVLQGDPALLKHPQLLEEIKTVLKNPCKYLPDKTALTVTKPTDNHWGSSEWANWKWQAEYRDYWRDMRCDRPTSKIKVILKLCDGDVTVAPAICKGPVTTYKIDAIMGMEK